MDDQLKPGIYLCVNNQVVLQHPINNSTSTGLSQRGSNVTVDLLADSEIQILSECCSETNYKLSGALEYERLKAKKPQIFSNLILQLHQRLDTICSSLNPITRKTLLNMVENVARMKVEADHNNEVLNIIKVTLQDIRKDIAALEKTNSVPVAEEVDAETYNLERRLKKLDSVYDMQERYVKTLRVKWIQVNRNYERVLQMIEADERKISELKKRVWEMETAPMVANTIKEIAHRIISTHSIHITTSRELVSISQSSHYNQVKKLQYANSGSGKQLKVVDQRNYILRQIEKDGIKFTPSTSQQWYWIDSFATAVKYQTQGHHFKAAHLFLEVFTNSDPRTFPLRNASLTGYMNYLFSAARSGVTCLDDEISLLRIIYDDTRETICVRIMASIALTGLLYKMRESESSISWMIRIFRLCYVAASTKAESDFI
ncbi:hypothetical protein HDU76_011031, partial [Blyttiomyces sp. JEL0837]